MRRFISFVSCLVATSSVAAFATRLPADLKPLLLNRFPECKVRPDGGIETKRNETFLPLVPGKPPDKPVKPALVEKFPTLGDSADILSYSNGWCFLRVAKKPLGRTVLFPATISEGLRKRVLACKFPGDLIVPDNFSVPRSLKSLLGDLAIPVEEPGGIITLHGRTVGNTKAPAPLAKLIAVAPKIGIYAPQLPVPGAAEKNEVETTVSSYVFVTSPGTGTITMLDGPSLKKVMEFPTEGTPEGMAYAEGKLYIADQSKNRILILDPRKKQFLGQIDLPAKSAPKGISALPNGKLLYVSESEANNVDVVETLTGKVLLKTKVSAGPGRVAVSPNGNIVGVLNVPAGKLTLISTANQKVLAVVAVGSMPNALAFSADSSLVYVSNRISNTVSIVDLNRKVVAATLKTGLGPTGLALSGDGKLFVANAKDNQIQVFDVTKKEKLKEIKLPLDVDFPGSLIITPDGQHIIVSSASTEAVGFLNLTKLEFESQPVIGHTSDELLWLTLD